MRTATFDTPESISALSLAEHRTPPGALVELPESLVRVAEEPSLRLRSERLSVLLEQALSSGEAAELLGIIWRGACAQDRAAVRCLMSLLEVRRSGLELLQLGIPPRQFLRACRRAARGAAETATEACRDAVRAGTAVAQRAGIDANVLLDPPRARQLLEQRARAALDALLASQIRPAELTWLCDLVDIELRATAARLEHLAAKVGSHDEKRVSRLLPVLSRLEERIRDTRALLLDLPAPEDLMRRTPVIVQRLEARFEPLLRDIAARPDGRELAQCIVLLSGRAPLNVELAFGAGIVRSLAERLRFRGAPPLDAAHAVLLALKAWRNDGLAIELQSFELRATRGMWDVLGVSPCLGGFRLVFDPQRHGPMLAEDGVPELTYPVLRKEADLRQQVIANIQNEHVLCGLLAVPRVAALPGLVEQIVLRTRSIKVLLEISNRRDMFTGSGNRNVPRALLWHPTAIPLSALRKFVHVRFVDRAELSALASRGSRARPEIRQMAAEYLASITSG